jgi:hypothetical protein
VTPNPDAARNTIRDGGFESGSNGVSPWVLDHVTIWADGMGVPPKSGLRLLAQIGSTASLYQRVTIPASAPYLRFSYYVSGSGECSTSPYITVSSNDGSATLEVDQCDRPGWYTATLDMSSDIGLTTEIVFALSSDNAGGIILLDDIGFVSGPNRLVDYY